MGFVIWHSISEEGVCALTPPRGAEKLYQLKRGISRFEGWPSGVVCEMRDEFPRDIQLADNMNAAGYKVISNSIKNMLVREESNNVEFLPISILNHKGRVASRDYFILNPLGTYNCIDLDGSGVKWNTIKKDLIVSCTQLVLMDDMIPVAHKIFRPKFWPMIILLRTELAEKLSGEHFTGLYFKDPLKYKGI
jgi:hypothetical protein